MEYTKDVICNVKYSKRLGIINLRRRIVDKVINFFKENKFITIVITSIVILTLIDLVLVNAFMNILTQV